MILAVGTLLGSCASPGVPVATRPADFALHVVVIPRQEAETAGAAPRWARPAAFLVEPGGRLRALFGEGALDGRVPPIARQLSPWEEDDLYATALAAGVLEAEPPAPLTRIPAVEVYAPIPGQPATVLFDVAAQGRARALAATLDDPAAGPQRALVEALNELTWRAE